MSNWLDGSEMSNIWGNFKLKLAENLTALSNSITQNSSAIDQRITKKQFGILNAFRYKSTDIFSDANSDIYKYLYANYATGYSAYNSNNYKKTITNNGRIFEYDCVNQYVIEINPTTGQITKYNMRVQNNNITYMWYIGTYVDGNNIYSYLWGTGGNGYGIFKVKHGNATYATSLTSLYIYDIAQDPEYYSSESITPVYSTATSYLRVRLSVMIGNSVYIICNTRTNTSSHSNIYDIYFAWDGTTLSSSNKPKKLNLNLPTGFYTSTNYHYERGHNLATDGDVTYSDSYKLYLSSVLSNSVTINAVRVVPEYAATYTSPICPCGFYDDYIVFGYTQSGYPNTLMLVPKNNSSYYEIVPFIEPYETNTAYYNRLIFTHLENGKNYAFIPIFACINGYNGVGIVLKNFDE